MDVVLRSATNFLPNASAITGAVPSDVLPDRRDKYRSFLPEVDARLTALLKGLACSTVVDLESGIRAIRIGNNEKVFLNKLAGDTIYERRFYPQLISAIRCADLRVLLLSNPGTGKSAFQFYLLARYLNPSLFKDAPLSGEIKFGSEVAPKVVIRHLPQVGIEVWLVEQQVMHRISSRGPVFDVLQCFDPATMLYFFEPGKTKSIEPFADECLISISTLATMSPDRSRYNEFSKVSTEAYMPLFRKEELVAIGRDMRTRPDFNRALEDLYSDDEIRGRFEIFNGIIRHVLPQNENELKAVHRNRDSALANINPIKFLAGTMENHSVNHYSAIYDVSVGETGEYDFLTMQLSPVNQRVAKTLQDRLTRISLDESIRILNERSEMKGSSMFGAPGIFERVVADHLTSPSGVEWKQRKSTVSAGEGKTNKKNTNASPPPLPTSPLIIKLTKIREGAVPVFADMEPLVLYKSLNVTFPFCDMMYKENGPEGKLVCIQVSLETKGRREVEAGAFKDFCVRMGWGDDPSTEQVDRIAFVYCPDPALADTAQVTVAVGVGIKEYTVWHVNTDYSSGVIDSDA